MPSTSRSEPATPLLDDSSVVVRATGLNLVFQSDIYQPRSWREVFTRASVDPVGALLTERDRLHVLRDLTFELRRGDRVALVGSNGAGKTSLCHCIAGHYVPTDGQLEIRGKVRAIFDTGIGIQPELTGRENAHLLGAFLFPEAPDRHGVIEEALDFSELGRFLDVPFRTYSNGMQTRLCLSVMSCLPTDLLVLDEVFEGADSFFREKVATRVLKMIQESGVVIFVSHSPDQVKRVCNRMILLRGGVIAYDGPVEAGIAKYQALGSEWNAPPLPST